MSCRHDCVRTDQLNSFKSPNPRGQLLPLYTSGRRRSWPIFGLLLVLFFHKFLLLLMCGFLVLQVQLLDLFAPFLSSGQLWVRMKPPAIQSASSNRESSSTNQLASAYSCSSIAIASHALQRERRISLPHAACGNSSKLIPARSSIRPSLHQSLDEMAATMSSKVPQLV